MNHKENLLEKYLDQQIYLKDSLTIIINP